MKVFLFGTLMISSLVFFSCSENKEVKETEKVEMISYGPGKIVEKEAISVMEVLAAMENFKGEKTLTFQGEIDEVCSNAGCWINIKKEDGETFMVRFKDHFTIPVDTKIGTEAFLHGNAYWDTIPVDMLQHFAEDAGKSKEEIGKITEPKFELAFEADAISFAKPAKKKK